MGCQVETTSLSRSALIGVELDANHFSLAEGHQAPTALALFKQKFVYSHTRTYFEAK